MELAPIEYMKWPLGVPRPSFDEVRDTALACMGIDPNDGRVAMTQKNTSAKLKTARQLTAETAEYLTGMSKIEIAKAMGYAGTSAMRDRKGVPERYFSGTHASVAMVNEVVYCLLRSKLNYVAAERKQTNAGTYKEATAKSLRNHSGSAV